MPRVFTVSDDMEHLKVYECKNTVLRKIRGKVYFFDDDLKWKGMKIEEAYQKGIKGIFQYENGSYGAYSFHRSVNLFSGDINTIVAMKIIARLEEGDHISKLYELAEKVNVKTLTKEEREWYRENLPEPPELEKVVMSIKKPSIYRASDNHNTKTFDFVEVIVNLSVYYPEKERTRIVKENRQEIGRMVLEKIRRDKGFQKYGVPVSVLTLKDATLSKNCFIRYLFEVKEIKQQ